MIVYNSRLLTGMRNNITNVKLDHPAWRAAVSAGWHSTDQLNGVVVGVHTDNVISPQL